MYRTQSRRKFFVNRYNHTGDLATRKIGADGLMRVEGKGQLL